MPRRRGKRSIAYFEMIEMNAQKYMLLPRKETFHQTKTNSAWGV